MIATPTMNDSREPDLLKSALFGIQVEPVVVESMLDIGHWTLDKIATPLPEGQYIQLINK